MASTVFADLFIRSAILILAGESLRRLYKPSRAAQRHRILLLALVFLAVLPLLWGSLPVIHIPIWPLPGHHSIVTAQSVILGSITRPRAQPHQINWLVLIWLCGVIAALVWVIAGQLVLVRVIKRAQPLRDAEWNVLANELSSRLGLRKIPAILSLNAPVMPLAFGLRRPRILLPSSCAGWSEGRKRVVLLHELVHIRRRDVSAGLFANCLAALWWFQPLVWITRQGLRRESEKACDADVIATGIRPSDYAEELISIAREFKCGHPRPLTGIAMACPRDLEGRVLEILDFRPSSAARTRTLVAVSLLTAAAITASAVTLSSDSEFRYPGGKPMKKTLLSGLLVSASLSAATLTGSVSEANGTAISNASVSLYNPDNSSKQESTSASDGGFTFENLPAGQYILRIEKPGFTAIYREFTLDANSSVERKLVLLASSNQPSVSVTSTANAPEKPQVLGPGQLRIGGKVMQSKLITKVQPVYPPSAKADRIQGTVLLDAVISKEGVPGELTVLQSPSDDLSQASLEAVRQWRYSPVLLNGQPIEVVTEVRINFTLTQ